MSSALAIPQLDQTAHAVARSLHVLTLTPFFPSVQHPAQGCFIAEPLDWLQRWNVAAHTIAVSPFYRRSPDPSVRASEWKKYYCVPGNLGLATSGAGVLKAIRARVLELQRSSPVSVMHAHAALPCGEAAMGLAKELGLPFLVSVHGLDVFAERQAGRWLGHWTKRRSLRVYERAERIVCISAKVLQLLPSEFHGKAQVIYNGVDTEVFTPKTVEGPTQRILAVGNLIPTKGFTTLLKAFSMVSKNFPDATLEVIGEGPQASDLAQLGSTLGISRRVAFRGRRSRLEVAASMRHCSVFALPSYYEGLGCVYLEAMACGKPVVACTGQGIEEIIQNGENGVLVPPANERALAAALIALVQDSTLRERLGTSARRAILQQHSLRHQASQLAALYRECAR